MILRLKHLINTLGDATQVVIKNKSGELTLATYEGEGILPQSYMNCHVNCISTFEGSIIVNIEFSLERFFRNKDKNKLVKLYISWLITAKNETYSPIQSSYGELFQDNYGYAYSQEALIEKALLDKGFEGYIMTTVEETEEYFE